MTRARTIPTITRALLLPALTALALGVIAAGPAVAFVDESDEEQAEVPDDEPVDEQAPQEPAPNGNGFVDEGEDRESTPVGGVDAGFGGGADQGGPGAVHAAAIALLALALAGHAANARRVVADHA